MNRRLTPSRRIRRLPVWLFAVALVLQMAMPFSQVLANAGADGTGVPVEICTGTGVAILYLDADGNATKRSPSAPLPVACEFCHLCQAGGLQGSGLASAPLLLATPETYRAIIPLPRLQWPPAASLLTSRLTRGPPALI